MGKLEFFLLKIQGFRGKMGVLGGGLVKNRGFGRKMEGFSGKMGFQGVMVENGVFVGKMGVFSKK